MISFNSFPDSSGRGGEDGEVPPRRGLSIPFRIPVEKKTLFKVWMILRHFQFLSGFQIVSAL